MTWKDLAYQAFRLAQVNKVAGRSVNTFENADALASLNGMLDAWNGERLVVPGVVRNVYPLEASVQTYTIGPEKDWNADQPLRIDNAGLIVDGTEFPIEVLRDAADWADVCQKSLTSQPSAVYVEPADGAQRLQFWPIPSQTYMVALYVWSQLRQVGSLDDEVALPPGGYRNAIVYNLALEIAAQNPDNRISPITIAKATEYKAGIKRLNIVPMLLTSDAPGVSRGVFDILTGSYR